MTANDIYTQVRRGWNYYYCYLYAHTFISLCLHTIQSTTSQPHWLFYNNFTQSLSKRNHSRILLLLLSAVVGVHKIHRWIFLSVSFFSLSTSFLSDDSWHWACSSSLTLCRCMWVFFIGKVFTTIFFNKKEKECTQAKWCKDLSG